MSIRVMSLVWDDFPRGGSDKLVMLAMADWCNDQGGSLHPSHAAVAKKCCMSRVQAQRIIRLLEAEGWLLVVGNQYGGAPGMTKQYRLNIEKLKNKDGYHDDTGIASDTGIAEDTGITQVLDGYHPGAQTGIASDTQTTIEPPVTTIEPAAMSSVLISVDSKITKKRKQPVTIDRFLAACREIGELPIPEDDPVFDHAEKTKIPTDYLRLCWLEFRDIHRESGKLYTDWRKAFRNCVRGEWYRLWYTDADGNVNLTSKGNAAVLRHREAA